MNIEEELKEINKELKEIKDALKILTGMVVAISQGDLKF
jgi:hypothetical protein